MMPRISEKIRSVQTRVAKAAISEPIPTLLAVSKTRSEMDIRQAASCGLTQFGENYLQEALPKIEALKDLNLIWHYIGAIQSNKTADIASHFDWVHTLDRYKIARRLSEQRSKSAPALKVLLQINIDSEPSKSGVKPESLLDLAEQVADLPNIKLRGLMAIPAPRKDYDQQLQICQDICQYYKQLQQRYAEIDTLSMGMSADLEAATKAGSTLLRIGTDIFGPRA